MSGNVQTPIKPVAGPLFRKVVALKLEGGKRKRIVALIAGFHDGGARTVTFEQLTARLELEPRKLLVLLQRLIDDGIVVRADRKPQRFKLALYEPESGS